MDYAYNTKGYMVSAEDADDGIYFCIECEQKVHLFRPFDKKAHFRHYRYNPDCELSKSGDGDFDIGKNQIFKTFQIVSGAIRYLKTNYPERWNSAIDDLIDYDCLRFLENREWAINPLNHYIHSYSEIKPKYILHELISILAGINNPKTLEILENIAVLPNMDDEFMEKVINDYLNNISYKTESNEEPISSYLEKYLKNTKWLYSMDRSISIVFEKEKNYFTISYHGEDKIVGNYSIEENRLILNGKYWDIYEKKWDNSTMEGSFIREGLLTILGIPLELPDKCDFNRVK